MSEEGRKRIMLRHPFIHIGVIVLAAAVPLWISAELTHRIEGILPAVAGAAKLVPDMVWLLALTLVPFAASSGSSRSPWVEAGLRNTESPDIVAAVSSWLPIDSVL